MVTAFWEALDFPQFCAERGKILSEEGRASGLTLPSPGVLFEALD